MITAVDELHLVPCLTPHGRLLLAAAGDAPELDAAFAERMRQAFARGAGHGLLRLGGAEVGQVLPPVFTYWREFGSRYLTELCTRPDVEERGAEIPPLPDHDLQALARAAPVMRGAEYLTPDVLRALWDEIGEAVAAELGESRSTVQDFLKKLHPAWNVVGRVHFNLAENRKDEQAPFAFLATYTSRLSTHGKAQHQPLGQALREYAGAANKERLLSLLLPVQRAAQRCAWLQHMVEAGEIFHPLRWSSQEALQFLSDVPELEHAGVVVRMPAAWRTGRPLRPQVTGTVGGKAPSGLGKVRDARGTTSSAARNAHRHRQARCAALDARLVVQHDAGAARHTVRGIEDALAPAVPVGPITWVVALLFACALRESRLTARRTRGRVSSR